MKKFLKIFLAVFCWCMSDFCHASPSYIVLSNMSKAQSVFVISNCTVNSGNYYNPVSKSSGTASFADGALSSNANTYYIGKAEAIYWSIPVGSSSCIMQIPAINSYLYFDSTGVVQDGSYSSSSKAINYLFKYPTSSQTLAATPITTLPSNYTLTYQSGYPTSTNPVLIKVNYALGAVGALCGLNNRAYSNFLCKSGTSCACNGTNCTCQSNRSGATCGTGNTPYTNFSCSSGNNCYCNGKNCTCSASSGGAGATCGTGNTPYTNFSCSSGSCYCNGTTCTCQANSGALGATCGVNGKAYSGYSCASGSMCWCSSPNTANTSCICTSNTSGSACGANGTAYSNFYCTTACVGLAVNNGQANYQCQ